MSKQADLAAFLQRSFDVGGLRRHLEYTVRRGQEVAAAIAWQGVGWVDVVAETVRQLERLDLVDEAFFEGLRTARDTETETLDAIERAWLRPAPSGAATGRYRFVVLADAGELGDHQTAVVERLLAFPGVASVGAVDVRSVEALPEADLVVLLLGWSGAGEALCRAALDAPGRIVAGLENQLRRRRGEGWRDDWDVAEALQDNAAEVVWFDRLPQSAVQTIETPVSDWLTARSGEEALLPTEWEKTWMRFSRESCRAGQMDHLRVQVNDNAPDRADIYVSLRTEQDLIAECGGALYLVGSKRLREAEDKARAWVGGTGFALTEFRPSTTHALIEAALCHPALRRVVIEGEAGSGKTWLLQHINQTLAEALLHLPSKAPHALDLPALQGDAPLLPIPIYLTANTVAEHLSDKGTPGIPTLLDAVASELAQAGVAPPHAELRRGVTSGRYLLLVDSLDEVPSARGRVRTLKLLEGVAAAAPAARIVLTTRPTADTGPLTLTGPLPKTRLSPMDRDLRNTLAARWVRWWGKPEAYQRRLVSALDAVEQRPTGLALSNPLLLTAALLVYESGQERLPDDAASLYHAMVEALCHASRARSGLSPKDKRRVLEVVFLGAQQHGGTAWPIEHAVDHLMAERPGLASRADARRLLSALANDTGLFRFEQSNVQRRGQQATVLRPSHRTFQEYLAACRWCSRDSRSVADQTDDLLRPRAGAPAATAPPVTDPTWQKVLAFLPGIYAEAGLPKVQSHLERLEALARAGVSGEAAPEGLEFADPDALYVHVASALAEYRHHFDGHSLLERLPGELLGRYRATGGDWPWRQRVAALDALGVLGDPRMEEDPWVCVPGGHFTMGGDDDARNSAPTHEAAVAEVWVAWRPVTVADYAPFVEGGGYDEARWWAGFHPKSEGLRRKGGPAAWEMQRRDPSRPVLGVSWWEAVAYCRWASENEVGRARWQLATGQRVSLPTETEWEFVARGPVGRIYPWGDDPPGKGDQARAAYDWGEGCPTTAPPVGAFPDGDLGRIVDLAGNALEWCLDPWRGSGEVDWRHPERASSHPARMLRGGSWFNAAWSLRSACQFWLEPGLQPEDRGFRLIRRLNECDPL